MEISCNSCNSRFYVPDEKIPKGKRLKVKCPKCGGDIIIEKEEEFPEYSESYIPEFYEEGKLAFFIGKEDLIPHVSKIEELGYKLISESDIKTALGKLRFHQFDLILLHEGLLGDVRKSPVMRYLNRLPMALRRKMFVVLLSERFKTADQLMAFALSVNLIVNTGEMEKLTSVLKSAIKRYEQFYRPFFEVMKETGRL